MRVILEWSEQLLAAQVGVMRRISSISKARSEPHETPPGDLWGNDIESSGAEAAAAKVLRRYWQAVHNSPATQDGDISGVEVRSTQLADGRLIIHEVRDKDDSPFVLVRGTFPVYDVVGWIRGRDAKKDEYIFKGDGRRGDGNKVYFVPANQLRPIEELIA